MIAKIQLIGLNKAGNETIIESVNARTHSNAIFDAAARITDLFFECPRTLPKYYIQVDLCYNIDGKEITVYTMLPFTWERTNGFCNISFFNNYFLHKVNNAVIESLDRNFIERMVRKELETINITNL